MIDFKKFNIMSSSKQLDEFKAEAFKVLNVDDNIETNEIFQLAWRWGYSGGYEEVFEHFKDLLAIKKENQEAF